MSVRNLVRLAAMTAFVGVLAACAEKPKPVVIPEATEVQPPQEEPKSNPTPVAHRPMGVLPGSQQDFVVNVGDRVYFDTDQSSLRSDAKGVLDSQASWLVRYPQVKVRIEGNADERGTREYNFALGARRAEAVSSYLISHGVVPTRITTISYGKENPIDTGTGEDSWAKNRNAHTAVTSGAR